MGVHLMAGFSAVPFYDAYNRASAIPKVTPEEVRQQDIQAQQEQQTAPKAEETKPAKEDTRSKTADLENVSLTFNKEDSFDYIGSESPLKNLDMQKAVSDMKKDGILQEYQYFVGSAQNMLDASKDGIVLLK